MHADSRGQVQPADDDVASGRSEQEGVRRSLPGHEATGRSSGSRGFRARPPPVTPPLLAHATTASLTAVIRLASARRGALRHGPGSARTLTLQIQTGQETPIIPNGPFSSPPADPAGARSRLPIEAELSHDRRRGGAAAGWWARCRLPRCTHVVLGEGGPQGKLSDGQAEGGADVVQGLAEGQGPRGSRAARDHQRVLRGAPSGCGSRSSHACLSQACVAGRWWSRSQVFCARTARSIMNQPVAGAADPGASMRRDLLKELQMRAGTWQCEKLGARSAARGPHGRRAAGLLPGNPRKEREPQ